MRVAMTEDVLYTAHPNDIAVPSPKIWARAGTKMSRGIVFHIDYATTAMQTLLVDEVAQGICGEAVSIVDALVDHGQMVDGIIMTRTQRAEPDLVIRYTAATPEARVGFLN